MKKIARWESRSGKHWVDLLHDGEHASYRSEDCGGFLGRITEAEAIERLTAKVQSGYFQPDANKTPMQQVKE